MRFEVPQFIEIEDKIFGPLTWKQFVYLGGGVGLAVVLLFTAPFILFVLIGVPTALLAAALGFYPVNSRPFSIFLESMWSFYKKKRVYYWRRNENVVYKETGLETSSQTLTPPPHGTRTITSLSRKLELNALQTDK